MTAVRFEFSFVMITAWVVLQRSAWLIPLSLSPSQTRMYIRHSQISNLIFVMCMECGPNCANSFDINLYPFADIASSLYGQLQTLTIICNLLMRPG